MKKNNKGFTLIELLAVVVVLIIIIFIAVSRIRKVSTNAQLSAIKANAISYYKAATSFADISKSNNISLRFGTFTVKRLNEMGVKVNGTKPSDGFISFYDYEIESGCLEYGKYKVVRNRDNTFEPIEGKCSKESSKYSIGNDVSVMEFGYTGSEIVLQVEQSGIYKLEVWGAQGGGSQNDDAIDLDIGIGGKGGYSSGIINLSKNDKLYLFVGGTGKSTGSGIALGGYNGGGSSFATSNDEPAAGGGGATDIRINSNSLYARVIVAGGGGGGGEDHSDAGSYAGGTTGGGSYGGTQSSSSGGAVFGIGASTTYDGGAGGGGWYGGGTQGGSQAVPTSNSTSDTNANASGGSGYAFTLSSNLPTGYLLDEKYQLTDAVVYSGNDSIPSHDTIGSSTGNSGNGYLRVSHVDLTDIEEDI